MANPHILRVLGGADDASLQQFVLDDAHSAADVEQRHAFHALGFKRIKQEWCRIRRGLSCGSVSGSALPLSD